MNIGTLTATLGVDTSPLNRARRAFTSFGNHSQRILSRIRKSVFSLKSAFIAFAASISALRIKDLALFAANIDLLRVSMEQLGKVNNINTKFLKANVEVMRSMGVSIDDAIRTVNDFIRINLDLTKVTKFVRVAQDIAVISLKTTSQTVKQLTRGIVTLNARMLRSAGVFFTAQQAAKEYAKANNIAVSSMTVGQKQAAVLNKIITDGEKVMGAYEASLSAAGKKVLQLNRLWKEAKYAIGSFTQEALMIGVESIQDFLKSIVKLRETGRLDEVGQTMSKTLTTIVNVIKTFTKYLINSAKFLYEWRNAIILVTGAFYGLKIISLITKSIGALNTALLVAEGAGIIEFLSSVQQLTVELGLLDAASISTATAMTILGTAITGLAMGAGIGYLIGGSEKLRKSFNNLLKDHPRLQKFVDDWGFGWAQIAEAEKTLSDAVEANTNLRIKLRIKEAHKALAELSKQESARRALINTENEFLDLTKKLSGLREEIFPISKTEKFRNRLKELNETLMTTGYAYGKFLQEAMKNSREFEAGFVGPPQLQSVKLKNKYDNYLDMFVKFQTEIEWLKNNLDASIWTKWADSAKNALKSMESYINNFAGGAVLLLGNSLGDAFHELTIGSKNAQEAFMDFARSFVSELNRMTQRVIAYMIVAKAAGLISGAMGPKPDTLPAKDVSYTPPPKTYGAGGIMPGRFLPFTPMAGGGIYNRPTMGLIAEGRHNEAVVPLPDGRSIPVKQIGGEEGEGGQAPVFIIQAMDAKSFEDFIRRNQQPVLDLVGKSFKHRGLLRNVSRQYR